VIASWLKPALPGAGYVPRGEPDAGQACPGLARALGKILSEHERPEILDLGQFCRQPAVYLADLGALVSVDDFTPPPIATLDDASDENDADEKYRLVINQPDAHFHMVLAWEHADFLSPDQLTDFGAEVQRILAPGGWLLLFAQDGAGDGSPRIDQAGSYRMNADDRVVRTPAGSKRGRWNHSNRVLERAFAPLAVQSIQLQRNRIREILVRKSTRR
jgi:hypothetical protein